MKQKYKTILIILIVSIVLLSYYLNTSSSEGFEEQSYDLPKIVWSYWDSDTLPEQIKLIYENNKKKLNTYEYRLVTNSNKKEYLGDDDINSIFLSTQHYSDWLRLYLLKKYGGIWMDISIIVNTTFDELWNKSFIKKSELTAFNMPNLENNSIKMPVIENWFIMAPKGSEIIKLWYDEYNNAIQKGFKKYKKEQIKNGVNFQNIFGPNEGEVYLTQHGCIQVVLQKKLNRTPNMLIQNANESMFKIQNDCGWKKQCLQEKINDISYSKKIPYIKLRGDDRKDLDLTKYFQES